MSFAANWNKASTALLTNQPELELNQSGFGSLLLSSNWPTDDCKSSRTSLESYGKVLHSSVWMCKPLVGRVWDQCQSVYPVCADVSCEVNLFSNSWSGKFFPLRLLRALLKPGYRFKIGFILKCSWLKTSSRVFLILLRTRIGLTGEKAKGKFTSSKYHHSLALMYILPLESIFPHSGRIWIYATSVLGLPPVNLSDFWGLNISMAFSFILDMVMQCEYFLLSTILMFPDYLAGGEWKKGMF